MEFFWWFLGVLELIGFEVWYLYVDFHNTVQQIRAFAS